MTTMTSITNNALVKLEASHDVFPVIDFGNFEHDPQGTASEMFDAASRWGFLVLKGHGIPQTDIDDMFATSEEFLNQPLEIKREKWMNTKQQGYDYKESVQVLEQRAIT